MNFKKKRFSLIAILLSLMLVAFAVAGCGGGAKSDNKAGESASSGKKQFVSIGSYAVGMPYYQMAVALGEIISKKVPNVTANAEASSGGVENARRVAKGELELGLAAPFVALDSYVGNGDFKDLADRNRTVLAFYKAYPQIVALKSSKIESIADLKGKKVAVGTKGSAAYLDSVFLLKVNNIDPEKDLKPFYINPMEATEMMKDEQIDAVIQPGALGVSYFLELASTRPIDLVPLDDNTIDAFIKEFPYNVKAVIPAGTYKGQDKDVPTVSYSHHVLCNKDLSEELVYNMTKAIYENLDELVKINISFRDINKETYNLNEVAIPLHPGALRYLKEVNAPGLDEFQAKMDNLKK